MPVKHMSDGNTPKNQFNHYVCRQLAMESPHDTNRLRYFTSDLIYIIHKSKVFIECNTKEFDCWNFRTDWFSNFNVKCVFLVGVYHIWSFTNVQSKSLGLQLCSYQLLQFPVHCMWHEHCSLNIAHCPNNEPCGTPNVMFDRGTGAFWLLLK